MAKKQQLRWCDELFLSMLWPFSCDDFAWLTADQIADATGTGINICRFFLNDGYRSGTFNRKTTRQGQQFYQVNDKRSKQQILKAFVANPSSWTTSYEHSILWEDV